MVDSIDKITGVATVMIETATMTEDGMIAGEMRFAEETISADVVTFVENVIGLLLVDLAIEEDLQVADTGTVLLDTEAAAAAAADIGAEAGPVRDPLPCEAAVDIEAEVGPRRCAEVGVVTMTVKGAMTATVTVGVMMGAAAVQSGKAKGGTCTAVIEVIAHEGLRSLGRDNF